MRFFASPLSVHFHFLYVCHSGKKRAREKKKMTSSTKVCLFMLHFVSAKKEPKKASLALPQIQDKADIVVQFQVPISYQIKKFLSKTSQNSKNRIKRGKKVISEYVLPHQKVLPTAKFFQVSIFFIPISLPEELLSSQEDENNKQVITRKI